MFTKSNLEERFDGLLEEKGGKIGDEARTILLKEESLKAFAQPLRYISEKRRDTLTPSLVILSCEAVGGKPGDATYRAALALTLMSLSFSLWDDIVDKTTRKRFIPTVSGRFGENVALIIGGLASAKAFSILNDMKLDELKRQTVTRLVWDYWQKLAKAEATNLELRRRHDVTAEEKLKVIDMQGIDLETSSKVGAALGDGSKEDVECLGNYGRYLSTSLELRRDFYVSVNLTLELSEKIRSGAFPYTILWAKNRSKKIREYLPLLTSTIKPVDMKKLVEAILETGALENILSVLSKLSKKAKREILKLGDNKPTALLIFLVEAQRQLFVESLSTLLG